jgi:hypothetical protein
MSLEKLIQYVQGAHLYTQHPPEVPIILSCGVFKHFPHHFTTNQVFAKASTRGNALRDVQSHTGHCHQFLWEIYLFK